MESLIAGFIIFWLIWLQSPVASSPVTFRSNFYWFSLDKRNHTDAEEFCRHLGGHLVYIEDRVEQTWLSGKLALYQTPRYWYTGLVDHTVDGGQHNLSWTSGVDVTYKKLSAREPSNPKEECVTIEKPMDFKWADVFCDRQEAFICKANITSLSQRMKVYKWSKYIFSEAEMNFVDAQSYCQALGADLVEITNQDELNWLAGNMPGGSVWYPGLFRIIYDGDSSGFWTTGAKLNTMKDSVPSGGSCVLVNSSDPMKWSPSDCEQKEQFICKLRTERLHQNQYVYWFDEERRSAVDGQKFCEGLGGNLAWIASSAENNRLGVYIASHYPSTSWLIGYRGKEGGTCWHGNFTCGYQNFRREISQDAVNICVSMSTKKFFQWEETRCDEPSPVVCKIHRDHGRYFHRGLYRYLFSTAPMNHSKAETFCEDIGGNLAWVEDQAESLWLRSVLTRQFPETFYWYIGLYDRVGSNDFQNYHWLGGHQNYFTDFADGEPMHAAENCVTMERPLGYKWADVNCSRKEAFVCKILGKGERRPNQQL